MQRTITAPDWEWGSREQCAAYLNIDVEQFKLWVRTGRFPFPPVSYGRKTLRWYWMDIVCYSHMRQRNIASVQDQEADNVPPTK